MFHPFNHFLSYGATDQQTLRELAGTFDGLVVPGTIAAFQRAGTGGFVLTISAAEGPNYVIDPRFPLFQQPLHFPKKSHLALADLLGRRELVSNTMPTPESLPSDVVEEISNNWINFNLGYTSEARAKFDKYAKRLGQNIQLSDVRLPSYILPPYTSVAGTGDSWWAVSRSLFDAASRTGSSVECVRVVAAKEARFLDELLRDVAADERLVIWISRLEELESEAHTLASYGAAVQAASARGQTTFALYGGFFAVLLSSLGLAGFSHGIGFGEYRDWLELPQSGPPPARYYLRTLHRYVSTEFAYRLWLENRVLAECFCQECRGRPPVLLEYHELMKHSVLSRTEEIQSWVGEEPAAIASRLDLEYRAFQSEIEEMALPEYLYERALRLSEHMPRWAEAFRLIVQ